MKSDLKRIRKKAVSVCFKQPFTLKYLDCIAQHLRKLSVSDLWPTPKTETFHIQGSFTKHCIALFDSKQATAIPLPLPQHLLNKAYKLK